MLKFDFKIFYLHCDLLEEAGGLSAVDCPVVVGQRQAEVRDKCKYAAAQVLRSRDNGAYAENGALRNVDYRGEVFDPESAQVADREAGRLA